MNRVLFSKALVLGATVALAGTAHAAPGDFANTVSRYNFTGLTGNTSNLLGVLVIKVQDFATFEQELKNFTGIDCSQSNGCYYVVDRNGGTSLLPSSDDAAERHKAVAAVAGVLVASPGAPIVLIDGTAADATNMNASVAQLATQGAVAFTGTYTIPAAQQGTVSTFLSNNPSIVPAMPKGALTSSKVVQVGQTQDASGLDSKWTTGDGGDIMAIGHNIPFPWATVDSPEYAAGTVLGRLNNQAGAPATRSVLLGAAGTHFAAISGSAATLGVFADGSSL